jgi:ABC-2 type transport system ATP-binding protein
MSGHGAGSQAPATGARQFDGAVKRFGRLNSVGRLHLRRRAWALTGFLGPNGAGKTTAMRAVFGLVDLDAGAVRWRGVPVRSADRMTFG